MYNIIKYLEMREKIKVHFIETSHIDCRHAYLYLHVYDVVVQLCRAAYYISYDLVRYSMT